MSMTTKELVYSLSNTQKEEIIFEVCKWILKHNVHCSEEVFQCDSANIDSINLVCDLVDIVDIGYQEEFSKYLEKLGISNITSMADDYLNSLGSSYNSDEFESIEDYLSSQYGSEDYHWDLTLEDLITYFYEENNIELKTIDKSKYNDIFNNFLWKN